MIKLLVLLSLVSGMVVLGKKKRHTGVKNKNGLRNLLRNLSNNFYATCELALFTTPTDYVKATKECKNFKIGIKAKKGNLVTVDSKTKAGNLMFLYDLAVPEDTRPPERFDPVNWIWTGLKKVQNREVRGKNKKAVKSYDPNEWKWQGTGKSPVEYSKWPKKKNLRQPDQSYLKKKKKGCQTKGGCHQNQMRLDAQASWDDGWVFEEFLYACDYKGKYILSNQQKTWESAKKACKRAGLSLAMVRSKREVNEMKLAIEYFLGPGSQEWDTFDYKNWVWLGGNDIKEEGVFRWLNNKPVQTWDVPWMDKAGQDNASYIKNTDGQHAIAFSRWGEFDDSFHGHKKRKRPFACQCPKS